jgi:TolB-like protein/Tfp pilus assembly protein PilF
MAAADPGPLRFDGLTLDPTGRTLVDARGEFISLRRSEFELLLAFVNNPGRVLSRDYLLEAVAGRHSDQYDRSIDVLVGRLRRKIEPEPGRPRLILTVPGIGYRLAVKPNPAPRPIEEEEAARVTTFPPAPRLSIVVLPFTNLSDDREQQYFADGVTDDLTTDLSRLPHMFVISRNTAFTYRNQRVPTKQIGRELGVRYVLEGSVRRSGNRVRVSPQLIDAETDAHLWAERFDGDVDDLFTLQDEITSRIAIALNLELIAAEAARPTAKPDTLDYVLRGRALRLNQRTRDYYRKAIKLYERALRLDPQSVEAQALLAGVLVSRLLNFGSDLPDADIEQAEALSLRALAAAPRSPLAHFARGQVLRVQGRLDEAIAEYETVLTANPNWVEAFAAIGRCKILIGRIEEAIAAQQQSIRLSPRDPEIGLWYFRIGQAHLLQSRVVEAISWFERACSASPEIPFIRAYLASAYALHGDAEQAVIQLTAAQTLDGVGNFSSVAREKRRQSFSQNRGARPEILFLFETTYFAGLRKAGMPEE